MPTMRMGRCNQSDASSTVGVRPSGHPHPADVSQSLMGAVTCPRSTKSFRNEVLSAAHKVAADNMARDQVLRVSAPC